MSNPFILSLTLLWPSKSCHYTAFLWAVEEGYRSSSTGFPSDLHNFYVNVRMDLKRFFSQLNIKIV